MSRWQELSITGIGSDGSVSVDQSAVGNLIEPSGQCESRFSRVRDAFTENFRVRGDVGASVAVTIDGELVVDLWGGHKNIERSTLWERDTITNVWSTTKTMAALSALLLASQGRLDLDAPVVAYWPDFRVGNKDGVRVRHVLSHSAGLAGWDHPLGVEDLFDWDRATSLIGRQTPWWSPGTQSGYHTLTQGYLLGEIVRRIDGRTIGQFFAEEIAEPLGADFHIGLRPEDDARVAFVIPGPPLEYRDADGRRAVAGSIPFRAANPPLKGEDSWSTEWRRAEIPAAGGHGNARSVALIQSVVSAAGSGRDVGLLKKDIVERIFEVQTAGRDLVLSFGVTFGMGYALNSPRNPIAPKGRVCYWGGWGGSLVVNDLDARMTMAYVMNRMGQGTTGDDRGYAILRAVYESLEDGSS